MRNIQAFTCYQNNISEKIINYQKDVFNLFGMNLIQEYTELDHPKYLDEKISTLNFDVLVFFDIDCIPLKPNFYDYIIQKLSGNNSILGVEQCCSSKDKNFVFAGAPCFAITKEVYEKLSKPSFIPTDKFDTAAIFTQKARENNVDVKLIEIKTALNQKWMCNGKYFGNGTIYEDWLYHQFEVGRYSNHSDIKIFEYQFVKKCKEVLNKYGNT
jgi:hypothetical protein